jgi:hypothetical protein
VTFARGAIVNRHCKKNKKGFPIIKIDFYKFWAIVMARNREVKKCLIRAQRQDGV